MSSRGKKVNKNNPKVKQERRSKKREQKNVLIEKTIAATQGISPRKPLPEVATGGSGESPTCKTCGVVLKGPDTKHKTKKHTVQSGPNKGTKVDFDPATGEIKQDVQPPKPNYADDLGKSGQGRVARGLEALAKKSDEEAAAEARREKTPSEQAARDAANAGVSIEELMAVQSGRASFIDAKPKEDKNLVNVTDQLTSGDVDQPGGAWSPGTKTGIFTPAPTGAIRGNRAQPTSPAVQENTQKRLESGLGLPGMGENAPSETIIHPVHGEMTVPADIARAHRLYDLDWKNNSAKANRLAGIDDKELYADPFRHKGGHYERLGRLQAAGQDISTIPAYARKMGQTEYDVVESQHALLQDKLDSETDVNFGMQHLHPDDTFTHPETGATHPMSEWSTVHNMPITGEGLPNLSATKGTNVSIYTDRNGNQQTTVPTHIGWWKTPTDGRTDRKNLGSRPGNWSFRSNIIPLDSKPLTAPVPAYDFVAAETAKAIPIGSKQSRAQISEAARAMAQIASASGIKTPDRINTVQITNPVTGLPHDEPVHVSTEPKDSFVTTDVPAEDPKVYKRSGRGKNVIKDINHLVSQQLAATVGGGPETAVGEITRSGETVTTGGDEVRGRSRSFVPAPIISNVTNGASALQPGKKEVAGTADENLELNKKLADQEDVPGSGGRGGSGLNDVAPKEMPSYRTDAAGNPIPNPPMVGGKGRRRLFVRGQSATGNRVQKPLQSSFERFHGLEKGQEGPLHEPARYATPFSPEKVPLTERQEWIQAATPTGEKPALSKPTMTSSEAQKYSRIYLQDNPDKGPAQPMLDFGAPEREEEEKRRIASKENGGVDVTTGKKFKRQGQQWGFLDPRWLGNIGETGEDIAEQTTQENRAVGSAHPAAPKTPPAGLPKAGPKSAPVDTDGAGPSTLRILGEMHGSKQIQDAMAKLRGPQATEE